VEFDEFLTSIAVLCAGVGKSLTPEAVEVYYDGLRDLSLESFRSAVKLALAESEFPVVPQIGTLRRLAIEAEESVAWPVACRQALDARRFAFYEPKRAREMMDRRTLQAVEAIGGMRRLADLTPETIGTYTSQLKTAFDAIGRQEKKDRVLSGAAKSKIAAQLRGIDERN
jgi:hypothetical protein